MSSILSHAPTLRGRTDVGARHRRRGRRARSGRPARLVDARRESGRADAPDQTGRASPRQRWLPAFVALAAIWGSSFLFIKVGVRELHPVYLDARPVRRRRAHAAVVLLVMRDRLPARPAAVGAPGGLRARRQRRCRSPCSATASSGSRRCSPASGTRTTPLIVLVVARAAAGPSGRPRARSSGCCSASSGCWSCSASGRASAAPQLTGQLMLLGGRGLLRRRDPVHAKVRHRPDRTRAWRSPRVSCSSRRRSSPSSRRWSPGARRAVEPVAGVVGSVLALGALGTGIAFVLNFRVIRVAGATTARHRDLPDADLSPTLLGVARARRAPELVPAGRRAHRPAGVAVSPGRCPMALAAARAGPGGHRAPAHPSLMGGGPLQQLLGGPGVDDPSGGTPHSAARSQPLRSQSSWPGACASVSMENRQPVSNARRSSRFGGSSRSGRQLISMALSCSTQAANTASASNSLSGRPPASRGAPGRCPAPAWRACGRCSGRGCPGAGWRARSASAGSSSRCRPAGRCGPSRPRRRAGPAARPPGRASRRRGCPPRCRSASGSDAQLGERRR